MTGLNTHAQVEACPGSDQRPIINMDFLYGQFNHFQRVIGFLKIFQFGPETIVSSFRHNSLPPLQDLHIGRWQNPLRRLSLWPPCWSRISTYQALMACACCI